MLGVKVGLIEKLVGNILFDQLRIQFVFLKKLVLNINFIIIFKYKLDNENYLYVISQIVKFWGKILEKNIYIYGWLVFDK